MKLPGGFTQERFDQLSRLWDEGVSSAEIGRRLDVTKNVVVSIARRYGFPRRPSPIRVRPEGTRPQYRADLQKADKPQAAAPPPSPSPAVPSRLGFEADIRRPPQDSPPPPAVIRPHFDRPREDCCWPIGEPGRKGFRYCDDPSLPGKPYCQPHMDRARVPRPASVAAAEAHA